MFVDNRTSFASTPERSNKLIGLPPVGCRVTVWDWTFSPAFPVSELPDAARYMVVTVNTQGLKGETPFYLEQESIDRCE